ncbi:TPA: hypothetical protein ACYA1C_002695 [Legionella pneumophila]
MTRNKTEKNIQFDFNECLEKAKANELSSLDILNNKDTWDSLSIKQKQRLCGEWVRHGYFSFEEFNDPDCAPELYGLLNEDIYIVGIKQDPVRLQNIPDDILSTILPVLYEDRNFMDDLIDKACEDITILQSSQELHKKVIELAAHQIWGGKKSIFIRRDTRFYKDVEEFIIESINQGKFVINNENTFLSGQFHYSSGFLAHSPAICMAILRKNPGKLFIVSKDILPLILNDSETMGVIVQALRCGEIEMKTIPTSMKNKDICFAALIFNLRNNIFVPEEIREQLDYEEIYYEAMLANPAALKDIPDDMKSKIINRFSHEEFFQLIQKYHFNCLPYLPDEWVEKIKREVLPKVRTVVVYDPARYDREIRMSCQLYASRPQYQDQTIVINSEDLNHLLKTLSKVSEHSSIKLVINGHSSYRSEQLAGLSSQSIVHYLEKYPIIHDLVLSGCSTVKMEVTAQDKEMIKEFIFLINQKSIENNRSPEEIIDELVANGVFEKGHPEYKEYKKFVPFLQSITVTPEEIEKNLKESLMKLVIDELEKSKKISHSITIKAIPSPLNVNETYEKSTRGFVVWNKELYKEGKTGLDSDLRKLEYRNYFFNTIKPPVMAKIYIAKERITKKGENKLNGRNEKAYIIVTKGNSAPELHHYDPAAKIISKLDLKENHSHELLSIVMQTIGLENIKQGINLFNLDDRNQKEKLDDIILSIEDGTNKQELTSAKSIRYHITK